MTAFAGTFVATRGYPGTPPSGLGGPGTLAISTDGLSLAGTRPRWPLIHGISATLALLATGVTLMTTMSAMARWIRSSDGDLRLFVALGGVVLVCVFLGVRALLLRVVRPVPFKTTVGFAYILSLRPSGFDRIEMVTTASEIQGVTVFASSERSRLVDEYNAAQSGPQGAYRARPPASPRA